MNKLQAEVTLEMARRIATGEVQIDTVLTLAKTRMSGRMYNMFKTGLELAVKMHLKGE